MRKFNWLMAAFAIFALAFAACKETPEPGPEPGPDGPTPPTPTELTFVSELVDVDHSSVTFNVTPSDLEAEYMAVIYPAKFVEQCATDEEIVEKVYAEIRSYAESVNITFAEYMEGKVKKGALEGHLATGLSSDTNYYILAFGVDSANDFAATSAIGKLRFKTETKDVPASSCTLEIKAIPYLNSASIDVTPSITSQTWHIINVPVTTYTEYTSTDGEYGWSKEQFFQNYLESEVESLKANGHSNDEILSKLIFTGNRTLSANNLEPKVKYTILGASVNVTDEEITLNGAICEVRYNSGAAAENSLTFDIEVNNIEHYAADVRITPSDLNAEYYYYIDYINNSKKSMKPIDIATSAINEYIYYWDLNELKRREPSKGIIDLTGDNKLQLNIAETEYYIVAFGFEPNPTYGQLINEETGEYDTNPGTITSAPVYVAFITSAHGDPTTAEFQFTGSNVGPYGFSFEITSSDPSVYYQPGIAYAEGFDPDAAIAASADQLALVMQMCMEGQSPCLTYQEALDKLKQQGYPYRNGNAKFSVANLNPETEYIGYVLTIDTKTGKFARCVYSDVIAKTTPVGTVTPKLNILGVYNGDEEAGSIFGQEELTAGRPIVAVELTETEGATALYSALTTDAYADVASLSARYIISELRGYWESVNLTVPYHFFVADWDLEHTIVAYAQDANGREGGVDCAMVKPVTPGDINELKGYVDAVNNATPSAKALAASLVYEEESKTPTLECVWSEEVEAPRAAKVIKHEVEPIALESDVLSLSIIKSFVF